jgi:hypothetical protein
MPQASSWKLDIHSQGLRVEGQLTDFIHQQLQVAFGGLERRVVRAHTRLHGGPAGCTCYMRVELAGTAGLARGASGEDARRAVVRASARLRSALVELTSGRLALQNGGTR